jgi:hypothetical protein
VAHTQNGSAVMDKREQSLYRLSTIYVQTENMNKLGVLRKGYKLTLKLNRKVIIDKLFMMPLSQQDYFYHDI